MVNRIIKDTNLEIIAANIKPDYKKRRVVLPKGLFHEGITFDVYRNNFGQIVLDPQTTIPASELWVFQNRDTLESIDKGIDDSVNGRLINRGSFASHAKNET